MSDSSTTTGSEGEDAAPHHPEDLRGHRTQSSPPPPFRTAEEGAGEEYITPELLQRAIESIQRRSRPRSPRQGPPSASATAPAPAPSAPPSAPGPSLPPTTAADTVPVEDEGGVNGQTARDRSHRGRRRSHSRSHSRSGSRDRTRRHRRSPYKRSRRSSAREELINIKELIDDMQRKAKLSEYKFSRPGTNKNTQFAEEVRKAYSTDMRKVLRKVFGSAGIPQVVCDQLAIGDKLVDDRIHLMKIADEYGWGALADFQKEELARSAEEERKLRRLRKAKIAQSKADKEKKEEDSLKKRRDGGFGGGRGTSLWNPVCYKCNKRGHIAKTCFVGHLYDRRRRDNDDRRGGSQKKKE